MGKKKKKKKKKLGGFPPPPKKNWAFFARNCVGNYSPIILTSTRLRRRPVELTVKNLLPWPEVPAFRFVMATTTSPTHYLALEVGIGIVLTSSIVMILCNRFMGSELLKPNSYRATIRSHYR